MSRLISKEKNICCANAAVLQNETVHLKQKSKAFSVLIKDKLDF